MKKGIAERKGFTLIELLITTVITVILVLAVGVTLIDSHRAFHKMYGRVYSPVVTDGHAARRTFDTVVRKSRAKNIMLDYTGSWLEVRYFSDLVSASPDRYARFYLGDNKLKVEQGLWNSAADDPKTPLSTSTVCSNVSFCGFAREAESVQMVLRLDNGAETATVVSSAITHN